ncbi:MAG: CPBP family intramembrane metalloprotease domain-containing protein [SAR86 cluster bacterium]|uniref:CPBP family intramembrane metalloprotease domain-containing protein n=1 Tax=SAR86 cluster bacterium TaxID=2030880 RepID=A0A2A4WYS4_9GAMM|nr:MAG: CPBP family intramembrane metalloprotease domain-containing protein [SAR86 cluster bacterium]
MTNNNRSVTKAIAIFLALLLLCYGIGYWLIFRLERSSPLMLSVGVAAIITCLLIKRPIASLGWEWGNWRTNWFNYFLPLAISSSAYLIIWTFGFGEFYEVQFVEGLKDSYNLDSWSTLSIVAFHLLISATFSFTISIPSIVGEEIGWRGFLVPELAKIMSFTKVSLLSGSIWAIFHWPLMFRGIYGVQGTPIAFQIFIFSILIMATSFVMTYFRYKTGSIWPSVLYHGAGNVYAQQVFVPLTLSNEQSVWYIGEFGVIPMLVTVAVAIYFWKKGVKEFSQS